NDRDRSINAFREALSRDAGYQPVRMALQQMKNLTPGAAEPVTAEVEPNNSALTANLIPLDQPVEGAIAGLNDEDYFRFTAPGAPRDILEVRVDVRSQTLAPGLGVYDSDKRFIAWGKTTRETGIALVQQISPPPNAVLYLQVWGNKGTEGNYTLRIKPLK